MQAKIGRLPLVFLLFGSAFVCLNVFENVMHSAPDQGVLPVLQAELCRMYILVHSGTDVSEHFCKVDDPAKLEIL